MISGASQVMVVPVDVTAFLVGAGDLLATSNFAGATTAYETAASQVTAAYLGANVTKSFSDPPRQPLEKGVHLHWALADALTRAAVPQVGRREAPLEFPAVPNRWLVSRLVIKDATPTITSWVVQSDALSESPPANKEDKGITVLVQTADPREQTYHYLGNNSAVDAYTPAADADRTFKMRTGRELSAVANGMPTFASFYPDCRSSFGFYDDLADLPTGQPANLMYVVTGWFDHVDNDPAKPGSTLAMLRKSHGWVAETQEDPARTLYSGFVHGIAWSPERAYIPEQSTLSPIKAEVAIGNNPPETLAAFFAAKVQSPQEAPQSTLFESLLNALQFGLLEKFAQPHGDGLARLRESLREKEFVALDGGSIYVVVKPVPRDSGRTTAPAGASLAKALDLPLKLADDLNALNILQQQYDLSQAHLTDYAWQLFADWYRLSTAPSELSAVAMVATQQRYQGWNPLSAACDGIKTRRDQQLEIVRKQIGTDLELKAVPAERYWQPAEPSILLSSADLVFPSRYGGDSQSGADGLACRMASQLITSILSNGQSLSADRFATLTQSLLASRVPHPDVCGALIGEACLLNSHLVGAITGQDIAGLRAAIEALLAGNQPAQLGVTGKPPSPVAVNEWDGANPWLPIFLSWNVAMAPLHETLQGTRFQDYPSDFFTANFTIDPDLPGLVAYSPSDTALDPRTARYDNLSSGWSILSPIPARHFGTQLRDFIRLHSDGTDDRLRRLNDQLDASNILVQSLNGFTQTLIMRRQSLQLPVGAISKSGRESAYSQLTRLLQPMIAGGRTSASLGVNTVSPIVHGSHQPVRTGYLKCDPYNPDKISSTLYLEAVDVFGQKREIRFDTLTCAASLNTPPPLASIAYLPPRLAQPARLLFRWIAADSAGLDEMNSHPATSPVCGWILPDHFLLGFFLYDQQGKPLGHLALNGDATQVMWQSAPADDSRIDQSVEEALSHTHPQLLALGSKLMGGGPDFFTQFWQAVDTVHGNINPADAGINSGLAILIGRPVALVQASLRLEVRGRPALDQSFACFQDGAHVDTDHGLTAIRFPVVLGDLNQWDDGLIGYFTQAAAGLQLDTFYTEGARDDARTGVVQPAKSTLLLTVTPKLDAAEPPDYQADTAKVLMLVDPRAPVHASMGILPTQTLEIPPDVARDALSQLEISFLAAPVLRARSGLAIPAPAASGFELSWIEQVGPGSAPQWAVTAQIDAPDPGGVCAYTPQILAEGWLRLNPAILEFTLLDDTRRPIVSRKNPRILTLQVVNHKPGGAIRFNPGSLVPEGAARIGSILYMHFGKLVAQPDVSGIALKRDGWAFMLLSDSRHGNYWSATPAPNQPVTLDDANPLSFEVEGLIPNSDPDLVQASIYFNYYDLDGASDGVYAELVSII